VTVPDGPQYAVISSHPSPTHSSRVELIFSVSTHVHLCSCPYAMSPDTRRRFLTQNNGRAKSLLTAVLMRGWVIGYWSSGGASQAPVLGSQVRLHASGCAAHTGGSVRKPPTVGPAGVCMTYGGEGGGAGSAPAVPGAATTMTVTARTILTVFIASTFPVGECPRQGRQRQPTPRACRRRGLPHFCGKLSSGHRLFTANDWQSAAISETARKSSSNQFDCATTRSVNLRQLAITVRRNPKGWWFESTGGSRLMTCRFLWSTPRGVSDLEQTTFNAP
jgi:hypothetical protein